MRNRVLLLTSVLWLTACGTSPKDVAQQYWQGLIDEDSAAVSEAVSENSHEELWRIVSPEKDSQVSFGETTIDGTNARVETHLQWVEKDRDKPVALELFTIMEKENDQWKVNTLRTRQQFFTAVYRTSLQGLSAALAEQLASFQVLGEAAAADFTDELNRAIDDLQAESAQANKAMQEFLQQLDDDLQEELNSINR